MERHRIHRHLHIEELEPRTAPSGLPTLTLGVTDPNAAEEGLDVGIFTFMRDSTQGNLVVYFNVGGTATNGEDYIALPGSVTIGDGLATATLTIAPIDDGLIEGPETVIVTLATSGNYIVGTPSSDTVIIADNDLPTVSISALDPTASEYGPDTGLFRILRNTTVGDLVVAYTISGTAIYGTDGDYTASPLLTGTVTIGAGTSSTTITITPIDDSEVEDPETVILTLSTSGDYNLGAASAATITIDDNDSTVTVTATDSNAAEAGLDPGLFTITRSGSTAGDLVVFYVIGGTATAGSDYIALPGSATLGSGTASITLTVTPIDDGLIEPPETVTLTLTTGAYIIGSPSSAGVIIADNDSTVWITATDNSAAERNQDPAVFTVTRAGNTDGDLVVYYTVGGTAVNGGDYDAITGVVTIGAGATSANITITPIDDSAVENPETVILTLTSGSYIIGSPSSATVTILDNDSTVVVTASDPGASETGPSTGMYTITRIGSSQGDLLVNYVLSGTAVNGVDYITLSGSVTIPSGAGSVNITVTPFDDSEYEGSETVILTLATNGWYLLGTPSEATVIIADNDMLTVNVTATDGSASEMGTDTGTFNITRNSTLGDLVVSYTVGGTATNGTDYQALSGAVTIGSGSTSVVITVTPIDDDLVEDPETVILTLSTSGSYVIGTSGSATIIITDNDSTVTIVATDASAGEGITPDIGVFTVTRTGSTAGNLTVHYTISGTATNSVDYVTLPGYITIPSGLSSGTIVITPINDSTFEETETVILTLTSGSYIIGSPSEATVIIADDDLQQVSIHTTDGAASEEGPDTGTLTVTRNSTIGDLIITYTVGGTATTGDYEALSGALTIGAGSTSGTIVVTPIDDSEVEDPETVVITLATSGSYVIGTPSSGTVTISDNDSTVTIVATDANAAEYDLDPGRFTITRSGSTAGALVVYYTIGGTATFGGTAGDYTLTPGTAGAITIGHGASSVTITVLPINDEIAEDPETVILTLTNGSYIIGSPNSATVTIEDNDSIVTLTATDPEAAELGPDPGTFTFTRTGSTVGDLVISYSVGGTAVNGTDYAPLLGQVTIGHGQASTTITLYPVDDTFTEGPETVILSLQATGRYIVGTPGSATVTITDNDSVVTVVASDPNAGEFGPNIGVFTVSRTGGTAGDLVVFYTVSGTATSDVDYIALAGTVTIGNGTSSATITVTPIDDTEVEPPETVILTLSTSGTYVVGTSGNAATVTIMDNDTVVTVVASDGTAGEASIPDTGAFTVTRTGNTTGDLVVYYTLTGTAANGTDFNLLSGAVTIVDGADSADIIITPIDDTEYEAVETVILTLSTAGSYTVGSLNSATVTISDDDTLVVNITAPDPFAAEPGTDTGRFTITRNSTLGDLVVGYTISGTAENGTDYEFISDAVTIGAGSYSTSITICPIDDSIVEGSESVILTLSTSGSYTIGTSGMAVVNIIDNDLPTVSVQAIGNTASESVPATDAFIIMRDSTVGDLVVAYTLWGTAAYGEDYTLSPWGSGLVTIGDGQASVTLTVLPIDDGEYEGTESVVIQLVPSGTYTIGTPDVASIMILDNDTQVVNISGSSFGVSEAGGIPGVFTFSRNSTIGDLVVWYTTGGTATYGTDGDYTAMPEFTGAITIGDGDASATITIFPIDDTVYEGHETVILTLSTSGDYTVGTAGSATVIIMDNETLTVTVTAIDGTASEAGGDTAGFSISRNTTAGDLVVTYTLSGTAAAGKDFVPLFGALTIGAGETSGNIVLTPIDDWLAEGSETVILTLTTNDDYLYTIGTPGSATVTIEDNDQPPVLWAEMGTGSASGGGISNTSGRSDSPAVAMVAGTDGYPIVAWEDYSSGNAEIYVRRWDGASWVEMGTGSASWGGISSNSGTSRGPAIAIGSDGNPIVAWYDNSTGDYEIYVKRWNGTAWVEYMSGTLGSATGGGISNNSGNSVLPALVVGTDGYPIVAWEDNSGGNSEIYVRRWNGASWVEYITGTLGSATGGGISKNPGQSFAPSIALLTNGAPVVAWMDYSGGDSEIYVRYWDGSSWAELGPASATGGGISNNAGESWYPAIAVGTDGFPIVTWMDDSGGNYEIYVRRWDGSSWTEMGTGSASKGGISKNPGASQYPAIVIGGGAPIIAWQDNTSGNSQIYVRQWNGASWVEMGAGSAMGRGISRTTGSSRNPSITCDTDGKPIVAWADNASGNAEIYLRRYMGNTAGYQIALVSGQTATFGDEDGSLVTVRLNGPGGGYFTLINGLSTGAGIAHMYLEGTTDATSLTITSKGGTTPGTFIGSLAIDNATGAMGALGTLTASGINLLSRGGICADGAIKTLVLGNVGDMVELVIGGSLGSFTAGTLGNAFSLSVTGDLGAWKAAAMGTGGDINVTGGIASITVNSGNLAGKITAGGTVGIGSISVPKGGLDGTIGAATGGIKTLTIGGDLIGNISVGGTAGLGKISITNGGLKGTLGAAMGGIMSLTVTRAITAGSLISAGTGGIGTITFKADADLKLTCAGKIGTLALTGTATAPVTLKGILDVKVLATLNGAYANLDGLTLRAADGLGKLNVLGLTNTIISVGSIGDIKVGKNVTDSKILSGYDVGADYQFGTDDDGPFAGPTEGIATGNIGGITIGGTMSGSSIAANVKPGADGFFGTSDDMVLSTSLQGAIKSLTVKGALTGSTNSSERFGVVAHQLIGTITITGTKVTTLPWVNGNIRIVQNVNVP